MPWPLFCVVMLDSNLLHWLSFVNRTQHVSFFTTCIWWYLNRIGYLSIYRERERERQNRSIKTLSIDFGVMGLLFSRYIAKFWNKTETKFIKQKFRMLFLRHQCNLSHLGRLSGLKWIASNCGWPTSKQNRLNQLIRDRLVKWRVAISLSPDREVKVAISLSLNLPFSSAEFFFILTKYRYISQVQGFTAERPAVHSKQSKQINKSKSQILWLYDFI